LKSHYNLNVVSSQQYLRSFFEVLDTIFS